MVYLVGMYIIFSILLIIKNHKNRSIIWFILMLIGFCMATFGLAFYNTYISSSTFSENMLFKDVEEYILMLNYYLDLDILQQFRIMNIGTGLYIYGAICFAVSFMRRTKVTHYILLGIIPLLLVMVFDSVFLEKLYGFDTHTLYEISLKEINKRMALVNIFFNIMIKTYLFAATYVMIYTFIKTPQVIRKKFKYMMIGSIPIWLLFMLLFFYFPNHNIIFRRYEQLYMYNFTYNDFLYKTVSYLCVISVIILIIAMFKYNIFETSERKKQIDFEQQYETANIGLRIFSHSIKNQFVAIKLLAEHLEQVEDSERKQAISKEILNVCDDSISKLSNLSKNTQKIELHYAKENINELIRRSIRKLSKDFINYEDRQDLELFIDKNQFLRVMDNLLMNGVEAVHEEEKPEIVVTLKDSWDYGIIKIKDNGHGIEEKELKKVIRPFYSTKPTVSNWGVGLAYCQKAIAAFGGVLHIDSQVNRGTTVEIYIPKERRG
ncbi:sensor histidine kinase [Vallitalea okinawensis]|uniref:sensor histidine kinase n=1 Tax=Vallitalea okinawensis TaxID=2078660 RepID=UPI00130091EB|nr:sensor histidine kinase [Vallitalea okinawensis]